MRPNERRKIVWGHSVLHSYKNHRRDGKAAVEEATGQLKRGQATRHDIWKHEPIRHDWLRLDPIEKAVIGIFVKTPASLEIGPRTIVATDAIETLGSPYASPRHEQTPPMRPKGGEIADSPGSAGIANHGKPSN